MSLNAFEAIVKLGKRKRDPIWVNHLHHHQQEQQQEATIPIIVAEDVCKVQLRSIPALPEEIAMACMAQVPRHHYRRSMRAVNRRWRDLLSDLTSQLYKDRRQLGIQEPSIVQLYATDTDMAMTMIQHSNNSSSPAISVDFMEFFPSSSYFSSSLSKYHLQQEQKLQLLQQHHSDIYYVEPLWTGMASVNIAVIVVPVEDPMKVPPLTCCTSWMEHIYAVEIFEKRMQRLAAMSLIREHVAYAILDGMLYAAGGIIAPASKFSSAMASRAVERYDFRSRCWSRVADMPVDMTVNHCAAVSGRLLLIGNIFDEFSDLNNIHRKRLSMQPSVFLSYCPCSDSWQIHDSRCLDMAFTCVSYPTAVVVHGFYRPMPMTVAVHDTLAGPFDGRGNRVLRLVGFLSGSYSFTILELQISELSSFNDELTLSTWQPICRLLLCAKLCLDYRENNVLHLHSFNSTSRGDSCVVSLVTGDPDQKLVMLQHLKPDFTVYFKTLLSEPRWNQSADPKLCPLVIYM